MLLYLINRITSERKVKKNFRHSSLSTLKVLQGTSWGRPETTSQGRPQDIRSGRPRDCQIGSLGDVLGTLEVDVLGTSWGPVFAGWERSFAVQSFGTCHSQEHKRNVPEEGFIGNVPFKNSCMAAAYNVTLRSCSGLWPCLFADLCDQINIFFRN